MSPIVGLDLVSVQTRLDCTSARDQLTPGGGRWQVTPTARPAPEVYQIRIAFILC